MVVARRKPTNKAKTKLNTPELSQAAESHQEQSVTSLHREEDQSKVVGKRKVTPILPIVSQREESKTSLSNHGKSRSSRSIRGIGTRTKSNQRAKDLVGDQQEGVGPNKGSGPFDLGSGLGCGSDEGLVGEIGPNKNSFIFPSPPRSSSRMAKPNVNEKELETIILESSHDRGKGQVGDLLQRKVYIKVETPIGQASSSSPSIDKLKLISTKIKCVKFEKIAIRGISRMDPTEGISEADITREASGDNQAFNDSIPREIGGESRADGSMEVEGN